MENRFLLIIYYKLKIHIFIVDFFCDTENILNKLVFLLNLTKDEIKYYYRINKINKTWHYTDCPEINIFKNNYLKFVRILYKSNQKYYCTTNKYQNIRQCTITHGVLGDKMKFKLLYKNNIITGFCDYDIWVNQFMNFLKNHFQIKFRFELIRFNYNAYLYWKNNSNKKEMSKILQYFLLNLLLKQFQFSLLN